MRNGEALYEARQKLLAEIKATALETAGLTGRKKFSGRVMTAIFMVPREEFVAPGDAPYAYINAPLTIGHGQTISQPYIVALMSDLLGLSPNDRVLEIGTGCGYQAAVLSKLAAEVYSVEVIPGLAEASSQRLQRLGYRNVHVRTGDGFAGWPEHAPYDAIIVTAAPPHIPSALIAQLKPGGRIVIPVGAAHGPQMLHVGVAQPDGKLKDKALLPVAFVPMVEG